MVLKALVQSADYTTQQRHVADPDEAMSILEEFDWHEQFRRAAEIAQAEGDWCFPGIAFGDGRYVVHLFRLSLEQMIADVVLARPRLWGLIPLPAFARMFIVEDDDQPRKLLGLLFDHDFQALADEARRHAEWSGGDVPPSLMG
jgi:hypothetical protein